MRYELRASRLPRRQRGFTLMEMMFALLAGAVLVTPLYVVLKGMSETSSAMRDGLEARQRARVGLSVLQRDLARVGLGVSPDSQIDGRSVNRDAVGSFAQHRRALIHITDENGNDALLLSGNFRGGRTYRAVANGLTLTIFNDSSQSITEEECTSQFDEAGIGSFAHVSGGSGRELDARATGAWNSGDCQVVLNVLDAPSNAVDLVYGSGDTVFISANQTVLYLLEAVTDHLGMPSAQLVRYFVAFDGSAPLAPASCAVDASGSPTLPGSSALIPNSRQVIADYVEGFQVWLRVVAATADVAGGVRAYPPHYTTPSLTTYLGDGFKPPVDEIVLLASAADDPTNYVGELGCGLNATRGVQHVRSAIVQLAVRTERADNSMTWDQVKLIPRHEYRMAEVPSTAPDGVEKAGAAYKVETFATEVLMPNLAGRGDLLAQ